MPEQRPLSSLLGFRPELAPQKWAFIYRAWIMFTFAAQAYGVLWIVLGLSLTVWALGTQDTSRMNGAGFAFLVAVMIVPSASIFLGAWRFRRWSRMKLAALNLTEDEPAGLHCGSSRRHRT